MLIVKLPKDRPPFMGVLIPGDNYGWSKLNQDLILEHKNASYKIMLEFTGNKLDLRLISNDQQIARIYKDIQYDPVKLTSWVHHTKNAKEFNFCHSRTKLLTSGSN